MIYLGSNIKKNDKEKQTISKSIVLQKIIKSQRKTAGKAKRNEEITQHPKHNEQMAISLKT